MKRTTIVEIPLDEAMGKALLHAGAQPDDVVSDFVSSHGKRIYVGQYWLAAEPTGIVFVVPVDSAEYTYYLPAGETVRRLLDGMAILWVVPMKL